MTTPAHDDADGVRVTDGQVQVGVWTIPLGRGGRVSVTAGTRRYGCLISRTPAGRAVELALHTVVAGGCFLSAVAVAFGTAHPTAGAVWAVFGLGWLVVAWSRVAVWVVEVVTPEGAHEVRACRTAAAAEAIRAAISRALPAHGARRS